MNSSMNWFHLMLKSGKPVISTISCDSELNRCKVVLCEGLSLVSPHATAVPFRWVSLSSTVWEKHFHPSLLLVLLWEAVLLAVNGVLAHLRLLQASSRWPASLPTAGYQAFSCQTLSLITLCVYLREREREKEESAFMGGSHKKMCQRWVVRQLFFLSFSCRVMSCPDHHRAP